MEPPSQSPAQLRGRLVARLTEPGVPMRVAWDSVRIGGPFRGKLVRLDDYRTKHGEPPNDREPGGGSKLAPPRNSD